MKNQIAKVLFPAVALLCLTPYFSSAWALFSGVVLAVTLGNPYAEFTKKSTHKLLSWSVIGLGAGMNLLVVAQVGVQGIGYTILGIASTLILGTVVGRLLKVQENTSLLITVGTAICGGSAIAAVSPVIKAKHHEVSVALGTVFLLNATALFLFPWLGHHFQLTEAQFGLWSALAIHDTSSVVGSTLQFGPHALEVGTTVKLARALWIVPVSFGIGILWARKNKSQDAGAAGKAKKPWFILGFLAMAALVTWVPLLKTPGHYIDLIAKKTLVLTLFFIGANLTRETIRSVGVKPFLQGVLLWILAASGTLGAILLGWI
ncbi:YeiH family protein [Bdellovibrio sp. HCB2-146]|uniref:YeiH family protein n=1 Tax=Bdellovibrio sp. HCB2-146 TaxID=3394362 RepID=UPI0039BCC31A